MSMSREDVVAEARSLAGNGELVERLARRIVHRTESRVAGCGPAMRRYFDAEIIPELVPLGFTSEVLDNPASQDHPLLIARRVEDPALPTVLLYGHIDVQFAGDGWSPGLDPWQLTVAGDRLYGRGTADNKGQHTVNLLALATVLRARGTLGWNVTILLESGEEAGSRGLAEAVTAYADRLQADLFLASDGPRYLAEQPTIFLGSRGCLHLRLECQVSDQDHHSGNWGGIIANPAVILSNALSRLVDQRGEIVLPELLPAEIPAAVRSAIGQLPDNPDLVRAEVASATWGQPGLSPAERLLGWNALEVISLGAGDPHRPVNAIPGSAAAHLNLRYVVGTEVDAVVPAIERCFSQAGLAVAVSQVSHLPATRLDPDSAPVRAAVGSITRTTGRPPAVLPNLGGAIPNHVFAELLGLPTVWIPHSYPGCQQHAADEHALLSILAEGLGIMAGIFDDLAGDPAAWQ